MIYSHLSTLIIWKIHFIKKNPSHYKSLVILIIVCQDLVCCDSDIDFISFFARKRNNSVHKK